ncbi:molybdopterin converting factor subunit 1 [Hyphomicrobium sp.]|jgi:molybdopterin synthase sulfur carrier subunit|uniref:molybdopterin converting factor subunit 1 n=1 Tax=Hyphomicrobium sp. TaxID=82 RepID=UPI002C4021AA|nr:molybdopterin converting factor subunit 1 [Hyphomicrobium sp.]HVZ04127.1 molybdopterin converting factor subunit 1 [Hyphomicrobium sp.]
MTKDAKGPEVTLRYFAWLREKTGTSEERMVLPPEVTTVSDLLRWQATRGHPFDIAFTKTETIRVALDHAHAKSGAPLAGVREIAFFPPVTGG